MGAIILSKKMNISQKSFGKSISMLGMTLDPTSKGEEEYPFFPCICIKSPEGTGIFVTFKKA